MFCFIQIFYAVDKNIIVDIEFNSTPFITDSRCSDATVSFNGSFLLGFQFGRFEFKGLIENNYISLTNLSFEKQSGINILKTEYQFTTWLNKYLYISIGTGVGWYKDAIEREKDFINNNLVAFSVSLIFFAGMPIKYLSFMLLSSANIIFKKDYIYLFLTSYTRFNIMLFVDFLFIFFDSGISYYNNNDYDINSVFFSYRVGLSLKLKLPKMINENRMLTRKRVYLDNTDDLTDDLKDEKKDLTNNIKTTEDNTTDIKNNLRKQKYDYYFDVFSKAKSGETMFINKILFVENNERLSDDSKETIEIISEVLLKLKISMAIGCYSDFLNNPSREIELSKKRALYLKNIFIKTGIPENNIKILASARVYSKEIAADKRFIDIKIFK